MTLGAGATLGPYEIIALIGAGGMGEVYRARDSRLGRDVAVKILPAQYSTDPDRLRRFEQEARAAGMLNHPAILSIYDIGNQDGSVYVVSELLTGETLRERLGGTALPVRKAVEYALQMANGLAAAHEKGIVHRDLKPENIFLTRDGRLKILDFGLAKLIDPQPVHANQSTLQTADPGTQPGLVLGTVGYMSPEQVRGRATDHRSDLFTFGAILYEMLTGKKAFHRDSTADTMSAILKEDPPELSSVQPGVPPSLERVVRHCLEKNPEQRFQSARDLAFDLDMVSGISGTGPAAPSVSSRKAMRKAAAALLFAILLAAVFIAGRLTAGKASQATNPLSEASFRRLSYRRGYVSGARFTPDGQSVVYSAAWVGAADELYVTRPQSPVSRSLEIKDAILLSISSTGEMALLLKPRYGAGWERTGTLARAPIDGGAPREVLNDVMDADWTPDGKQLVVVRHSQDQYTVEFPVGKVLYRTNGWVNHIRISPDGDRIAMMVHPGQGDDRGTVNVVDLKGNVKILTPVYASESGLHWSPDGREIWYTASTEGSNEQPLYAVNLEGRIRVVAGMVGNLILQDVRTDGSMLICRDSRRREIIALPQGQTREQDYSWFDWSYVRDISDDGSLMVFEEEGAGGGPNYSVYIRKTDGSPAVRLGDGYAGPISYDGKMVLSLLPGVQTNFTVLPTGAGEPRNISSKTSLEFSGQFRWFHDNQRVLVLARSPGKRARFWILDLNSQKATPVTPEGVDSIGLLSPDERFVLAGYPDNTALYPVQGGAPQEAPAIGNGFPLQWTPDGRQLYLQENATLPIRISLFNVATRQRTLWKEITPPDISGIVGAVTVVLTPDGKTYAYTYRRALSDLYLVKGLK